MTKKSQTPERKRVAIFGGSFNPPGLHHQQIAQLLAKTFDEVVVVPCGPRSDKPLTNDVPPVYRAAMVDMTFSGLDRVRVDLFDLESSSFTRTYHLQQRLAKEGELWHVIGGDLVKGGQSGLAAIQKEWVHGDEIWNTFNFAVIRRPHFDLAPEDAPPHHRLFEIDLPGSSSEIRMRIFQRKNKEALLHPKVNAYIQRHALYSGRRPHTSSLFHLKDLRPMIIHDQNNPEAAKLANQFEDHADPNLIVVIGGDGTMLQAIRQNWRHRLPFYGVNAGHLGFLLNELSPLKLLNQKLSIEHLPLLRVDIEKPNGEQQSSLAFNDAWVERAFGQTAWIEVRVNGRQRLPRLVADGALIATAAGSTSYARAMGAPPMPLNTSAQVLVGSNVLNPTFFKPVVLDLDSTIELTSLNPNKRPLRAYIDGREQGQVKSLQTHVSKIAAVELAFDPRYSMAEKLARIQFPPVQP
jgi:nicotinate (nicotinamide) nucleotide adenylyltransferase